MKHTHTHTHAHTHTHTHSLTHSCIGQKLIPSKPNPVMLLPMSGKRCLPMSGKRWEDNSREWTGLGFADSQRAVENRGEWRKLVSKSSVVPQRPSRLRDDEVRP